VDGLLCLSHPLSLRRKAKELLKEAFKRKVERHLTGQETEPWEIIYFKPLQKPNTDHRTGLRNCSLMLGSQKSRSDCMAIICADFLAGATLHNVDPETFLVLDEKIS
jgi:hypothetical protein